MKPIKIFKKFDFIHIRYNKRVGVMMREEVFDIILTPQDESFVDAYYPVEEVLKVLTDAQKYFECYKKNKDNLTIKSIIEEMEKLAV